MTDAPDKDKNIRSPETVEPARPWTKEEMEEAKPLPLPTVDAPPNAYAPGFPYAGTGGVTSAGRPERAEAKPLPLPTVDAPPNAYAPGLPYTGTGGVTPAGRPERAE
jgi:hypothetical protein